MKKYVPILSWKKGEQDSISNLNEQIKDMVQPLFEIAPKEKVEEQFQEKIKKCWEGRKYYFYLTESWYDEVEDSNERCEILSEFYDNLDKKYAIPVFNLSDIYDFERLINVFKEGICIRIQNNEYSMIDSELNGFIASKNINTDKIDLLLDLRYIKKDILFEKQSLLKVALMDINEVNKYRSIIVASCSFPQNVSGLDSYVLYKATRLETEINKTAINLSGKLGFNFVYSDYVLSNLSDVEFVVGMKPGFKIRYTIEDKYLFVKGKTLIKGGLDLDEVKKGCRLIATSPDFKGKDYSWGDQKIDDLANSRTESTGNLTSWVAYTYNHHITFIIKEM